MGIKTNTRASSRVTDCNLGIKSLKTGAHLLINLGFLLSIISASPRIRLTATELPMLKKSGCILLTKLFSARRENSHSETILERAPSIKVVHVASTIILLDAFEVTSFARFAINYLWKLVLDSTVGSTSSINEFQLPSKA